MRYVIVKSAIPQDFGSSKGPVAKTLDGPASRALAFHDKYLRERRQYAASLNKTVFSVAPSRAEKEFLSRARLLTQPIAYEVLVLIWANSPYPFEETSIGEGVWQEATGYSISRILAGADGFPKMMNYVARVIDAATYFGLVDIKQGVRNKNLLQGTEKLHRLMMHFAEESTAESDSDAHI